MASGILVGLGLLLLLVGAIGIAAGSAGLALFGILFGLFALVGGLLWGSESSSETSSGESTFEWDCSYCGFSNIHPGGVSVGDHLFCSHCGSSTTVTLSTEG